MMGKQKITDFDRYVGERIREARHGCKMSQTELGKLLGVSFQQVQKYETGANRAPSARLERMVTALNRPLMFFFPNPTDVRTTADPIVSALFSSSTGLELATKFPRLRRSQQRVVLKLMDELLEHANG
jgi:transcriptional regulator with XRE-family HTH domain